MENRDGALQDQRALDVSGPNLPSNFTMPDNLSLENVQFFASMSETDIWLAKNKWLVYAGILGIGGAIGYHLAKK